jgi:hypothetical protein
MLLGLGIASKIVGAFGGQMVSARARGGLAQQVLELSESPSIGFRFGE